jgi:SAM-dependent methyltransferase
MPDAGLGESARIPDEPPPCPLCRGSASDLYHVAEGPRDYFKCRECELIYLHPSQRLSLRSERERYELHRNDAADPGYVRFLERLALPLMERLPAGAHGIDFGCGPAPVLSALLSAAGFPCVAYDPLFAPDTTLLSRRYDFVTCSEVVEHAHDPSALFATLGRLLQPRGLIGVMTRFHGHEAPFGTWWYRRDPTHVSFYSETTMLWIARYHGWSVTFPRPCVALFSVPES